MLHKSAWEGNSVLKNGQEGHEPKALEGAGRVLRPPILHFPYPPSYIIPTPAAVHLQQHEGHRSISGACCGCGSCQFTVAGVEVTSFLG